MRTRPWLRPLLLSAALLGGLASAGCNEGADQVELRLFPCEFAGVEPRSVVVEITGYDDQGELVESFEVAFDDIAAKTFEDGYATVGYRKDPRVVVARFRIGWFSTPTATSVAEAEAVAVYDDVAVPELGEVLRLTALAGDCSELAGDGDGDPSGDGDGDGDTTTGDGDGDGDPSTGDGDGDPSTGDGDGDPSTGDGDGDPTTGDGDGDPGEDLPMPGDPCDPLISFQCTPAAEEQGGTPLFCDPISMQLQPTNAFPSACQGFCAVDTWQPVDACAGYGIPANCLCLPDPAESCGDAVLGCTGDDQIKLCYAGTVVIGECVGCSMTPGGYYSCTR